MFCNVRVTWENNALNQLCLMFISNVIHLLWVEASSAPILLINGKNILTLVLLTVNFLWQRCQEHRNQHGRRIPGPREGGHHLLLCAGTEPVQVYWVMIIVLCMVVCGHRITYKSCAVKYRWQKCNTLPIWKFEIS